MKVYEIRDEQGRPFAFEVDALGRRYLCRALRRIPGVTVTRGPRFLSWFREGDFCEFEVRGVKLLANEPYGDNSRYWVGPVDTPAWHPEVALVIAGLSGAPRRYLDFDPSAGYPAGEALSFECGRCGEVVPSLPRDSVQCSCSNVRIDVDAGRVAVSDHAKFRVFTSGKR